MTEDRGTVMFADVDRALVMSSLAEKLRTAGIDIPLTATIRATEATAVVAPLSLSDLYWIARLSFVADRRDLGVFDELFDAVFDTDHRTRDRRPFRANASGAPRPGDHQHSVRLDVEGGSVDGGGVPWATLPALTADTDDDPAGDDRLLSIAERLPSAAMVDEHKPFDLLDDDELAAALAFVFSSSFDWPKRVGRRRTRANSGDRYDLRAALRRSLTTAGEPMVLPSTKRRPKPRPIAVLLDVSASMEGFARAYLSVARAFAIGGRAEVFAFGVDATRITAAMRLRSPVEAMATASEQVGDRFGGTKIAASLRTIIANRPWNAMVRGAATVVVSDGWDTDEPAELGRQVQRLQRLSHRLIWVNPRLAGGDYEPSVAGMAAALPFCDEFLPGHSPAAMADVLEAISR